MSSDVRAGSIPAPATFWNYYLAPHVDFLLIIRDRLVVIFNYLIPFLPVKDQQESKIEIIWKGLDVEKSQINNDRITFLQQKMQTLIEIISEDITDESVKQKLRDFSLNRILDE